MAFVKLDVGILDSSLWWERVQREVFITALLMAQPYELEQPAPQLDVRTMVPTGFIAPPGWYGLIEAAGVGIVSRAGVGKEEGMVALEVLGGIDSESRSKDFEGRRLIRVDGGFLVLNFIKYREKDHTNALRQRKFRQKKTTAAPQQPPPATRKPRLTRAALNAQTGVYKGPEGMTEEQAAALREKLETTRATGKAAKFVGMFPGHDKFTEGKKESI